VIAFRHLVVVTPQPLWGGAARMKGARFTPRSSFDSIYLAGDAVTALSEVRKIISHPSAPAFTLKMPPQVVLAVNGVLTDILDLTDPATQSRLGTTRQEITGRWSGTAVSPTQVLAQTAYDVGGIVGFKYESAQNPNQGDCLVVFSDRLAAPGFLEVHDPDKHIAQRIP